MAQNIYNMVQYNRTSEQTEEERLSDDLYRLYNQSDRMNWAIQAAESIGFLNNLMWEEENAENLKNNNQAPLCINEVTPAMQQIISKLTENQPRFTASARKDFSVNNAAIISDLVEYIWYISNANLELKYAIKDSKTIGIGALMAYFDQYEDWGKGEIKIMGIDPRHLYIDPNSKMPDASDACTIIYRRLYTAQEIASLYPDFDITQARSTTEDDIYTSNRYAGEGQTLNVFDLNMYTRYAIIDRYTKTRRDEYYITDGKRYERVVTQDDYEQFRTNRAVIIEADRQPVRYALDEAEVRFEMGVFRKTGGLFHYEMNQETGETYLAPGASDNGTQVRLTVTSIGDLIDIGVLRADIRSFKRIQRVLTIGGKAHYDTILPIENHPIVTIMRYHNRNPYATGDMPFVIPLQEELNKIHSLAISYMQNISGIKVFVPQGTNMKELEERLGMSGTQAFEYDPSIGVPVFAVNQPMPNAFLQQGSEIVARIQRILGAYTMQDGDMQYAPRTADGTQMLLEAGSTRMMSERFDIEASLNQLGRVIVEMIPHYYTERKVIRLRKAGQNIKEFVINDEITREDIGISDIINDVTIGKYDVEIVSGSMLPTNRAARAKAFTELWQLGVLQDSGVILRQYEIEDVEEIIAKQDRERNQAAQIEQLNQALKDANGQLQRKVAENINLMERIAASKTDAKLHKIASDAAAQTMIQTEKFKMKVQGAKPGQNLASNTADTNNQGGQMVSGEQAITQ